jgi:hypothetical protein
MPPVAQLLKNFPTFYGTQRFITVFTRALHWSLSWTKSIQSIPPHPICLRSILILTSHLCLGLHNGLFPSDFPAKILPHSCYMSCPSHPPWLDNSSVRKTNELRTNKCGPLRTLATILEKKISSQWLVGRMMYNSIKVIDFISIDNCDENV